MDTDSYKNVIKVAEDPEERGYIKRKVVPLHAIKAYEGRGGITPLTDNVGTRR